MEENENASLSAVERLYPEWVRNAPTKSQNECTCSAPCSSTQIVTLEHQLKKSDGAKVDQEILRTLLMKVPCSYFLTLFYYIIGISFLFYWN
jgi:hypothetical protein